MTRAGFRKIALSLPETAEGAHQGGPDFRVAGKIFATFGTKDVKTAVVRLTPGDQEMLCAAEPELFSPIDGAWGRQGWTKVHLAKADSATVRSALTTAWRTVAPKKIAAALR